MVDSDHPMQSANPEAVVKAIRQVERANGDKAPGRAGAP